MAQNGYVSFSFDTRGVGGSSGRFEEGSLKNRLTDAQAAYDKLSKFVDNIIVIGRSMGGHVATFNKNIAKEIEGKTWDYVLVQDHQMLGSLSQIGTKKHKTK